MAVRYVARVLYETTKSESVLNATIKSMIFSSIIVGGIFICQKLLYGFIFVKSHVSF
jgi:hypothetical protein